MAEKISKSQLYKELCVSWTNSRVSSVQNNYTLPVEQSQQYSSKTRAEQIEISALQIPLTYLNTKTVLTVSGSAVEITRPFETDSTVSAVQKKYTLAEQIEQ